MKYESIQKLGGIALVTALALANGTNTAMAQQSVIREACAADYKSLCSGVQPGGGRIIACLKENAGKLSPGCQKALESAKAPQ
ncbi:cysteine rich repeat-containing protein [Methyloferula stellata]|uniref:cysteine rich repeat-containing protein n=1 Tax=Methyloferula stellata TaxID=876270 RepID=UPI0003691418|nr:cysteine rich repeat-containing protein [Methyloferula stellata]